ncbi:unnamed protein product [Phaedon cochleariae]|uniref:RNA helicase n=1 Tax=Phaedon cochleariae TaxID=80249 RepID=A0A9P0DRZ4_PHACE|nr:unnamed protein product [Phaedon cochleariae]
MWSYITSFFDRSGGPDDLSLENACSVLENIHMEDEAQNCTQIPTITNSSKNMVSSKTGVITKADGNDYIIDNLYTFLDVQKAYIVNTKVTYNLVQNEGITRILNVEPIDNEWDIEQNEDLLWNNRILVCKVEKRVDRKLHLSPWDIIIDLNNISIEFLPILGDWLELDVKCTVNENSLDLSGKVIEVNRASPVRAHIESGKISSWNDTNWTGIIDRNIFFNKQALSLGYIPALGDKVVAEVIESDQNRCTWRAVKILPEQIARKHGDTPKNLLKLPEFQEFHPGLTINQVSIVFKGLNETQTFLVTLSNESDHKFTLLEAQFLNPSGQCRLVDHTETVIEILSDTKHELRCVCTSKNIGTTREFLLLRFDTFTIGKWIEISISTGNNFQRSRYEQKPRERLHEDSTNELIRGQASKVRFAYAQLPTYLVPRKLIDTVSAIDNKNPEYLIEQLRVIKPCLVSNLSYTNYEDKFHSLLHLDEISNLIAIQMYDQEKACFIPNAEFLMLEIDNLSERRPSIVIGDRIIATDPDNRNKLDFEGFVNKVGAKHVYIKFGQLFHDTYKGEDYSIKVIPGRNTYKRLHHAVYLAVRNLGQEILFPSRISEKDPQVNFVYDIHQLKSGHSRKKVQHVLSKAQEFQKKSKLTSDTSENSHVLTLEWYNERLNPRQKHAVVNILLGKARPLPYIIFGPPGTGKTVTIIETILQIVRLMPQSRLLVTAPSNSAADLIALRLVDSGVLMPGDLVRVVSHNYAMSSGISARLVPFCATGSAAKEGTVVGETMGANGIRLECNRAVLGRHRITVATCNSTGQFFTMGYPKGHFSHIIVDEAAQAAEPDVMIPMAFLDKNSGQVILAGDPMQLGPVVLCKVAAQCGLDESYLERVIHRFPYVPDPEGFPDTNGYDPRLVTKLLYNYRSLPDILNLYNLLFYNNELIPMIDDQTSDEAKIVEALGEILPKINGNKFPRIIFHGVDGENYQTSDSPSWYNPDEAAQVFYYTNEFYRLGLRADNVGIITPYIKQVKEIRSMFQEAEFDQPKIGTVEEFQGQEFEVVLLSTVRSCEEHVPADITHSLGFVASPKRLNVAISRAKSLLVVIGNPNLLCQDTYWRSVVKYCVEVGSYIGCDFDC